MKKLKLNLSNLRVESFKISTHSLNSKGTVNGNITNTHPTCDPTDDDPTCASYPTCAYTCGESCINPTRVVPCEAC